MRDAVGGVQAGWSIGRKGGAGYFRQDFNSVESVNTAGLEGERKCTIIEQSGKVTA